RGHDRLDSPGACSRDRHFADRAVHDAAERAWLKHFVEGWLKLAPTVRFAQAAE
ncbi:MAG: glutamine amidotransferase, partial [Bradyrhizobium sp.]|nr:glutamine amidotransferase [Bradyrhizobium sp.]